MINSDVELEQSLLDCLSYVRGRPNVKPGPPLIKPILSGLITTITRTDTPNGHHFDVGIYDGSSVKIYPFAGVADAGQGGSLVDPTLLPVMTKKITLDATPPSGTRELYLLNGWAE